MKHAHIIPLPFLLLFGGCRPPQPGPQPAELEDASFIDPNCQVNVVAGAPIPNRFNNMTAAQRADATNAIGQLAFADLYRNPPFRINGPANLVRLDVQGALADGSRNWQVQINIPQGHSTVSTMLVAGGLAGASTPDRQASVQRSARSGLVQSLTTGNIFNVNGNCN